ncbi:MAG: hypothetical protein LBO72_11170, partial [Helicobacteraceae bacterium]|nr:hypothetical protein [Helicobacteraceae bacterium]
MANKYDRQIDGYEIRFLVSESGDEYIEIEHRGRIADMYADDAKAIADYVLESKVGDKIVKWR